VALSDLSKSGGTNLHLLNVVQQCTGKTLVCWATLSLALKIKDSSSCWAQCVASSSWFMHNMFDACFQIPFISDTPSDCQFSKEVHIGPS
jgi:hypothetical protein